MYVFPVCTSTQHLLVLQLRDIAIVGIFVDLAYVVTMRAFFVLMFAGVAVPVLLAAGLIAFYFKCSPLPPPPSTVGHGILFCDSHLRSHSFFATSEVVVPELGLLGSQQCLLINMISSSQWSYTCPPSTCTHGCVTLLPDPLDLRPALHKVMLTRQQLLSTTLPCLHRQFT